jgi:starch-binding outer membrane protein, SusD/RagB family
MKNLNKIYKTGTENNCFSIPMRVSSQLMRQFMLPAIAIFSLLMLSCDDEAFLDKKPHTQTDASFYTSTSGAIQGINAAYDILQLGENVQRQLYSGTVCSGDALTGGEPGGNDQTPLQQFMKFQALSSNSFAINLWNSLYRGIYRTNLLIGYLKEPIEGFDEDLRKRILGEAYFLRGLFHFKLQVIYGGVPQSQSNFDGQLKGIPFIDKVLLKEEWNPVRPTIEYTWGRIEDDFKTASDLLPWQHDASNIGRATKGSAKSMLAKTYLYTEQWELSYQAAKEVITSGHYHLIGETGHNEPLIVTRLGKDGLFETQMAPYKWIWQPEANNCAESVFEVQYRQTGMTLYPQGQEGNLTPRYYGPRAVYAWNYDPQLKKDTLIVQEYFWGFILPTHYFVKTAYKDIGGEVNGEIVDPRFTHTVVKPTDKFPYRYENPALREKYPDSVAFAAYHNNPATGYSTWKYFTDPIYNAVDDGSPFIRGSLGDGPQSIKYFRFADLLLIGAEAAVNSNHNDDALAWINRVRDRARNSGNTGYPKALSSVSKEQIWAERRVELAFEGHQYWDIVRTNRQEKILKQDALEYEFSTNPFSPDPIQEQFGRDSYVIGKHEIWPIPDMEIRNTNGSLSQNPGY